MSVRDSRTQLLEWIDRDRDRLVGFLQDFIRAKSPNPPGDTLEASAHVAELLDKAGLEYRTIAPEPTMPNIVASFDTGRPGPHLVLNGHMDVFPVSEDENWSYDPWSAQIVDGKIYGRGACDMKSGTTASIFTYLYLSQLRDDLTGRLTLTAVSDEETFGPWGARHLIGEHPEVHGDCLLNAEPSSPYTVRFGEKGTFWLDVIVTTKGAHGAYAHVSPSATKIAANIIADLESLSEVQPHPPEDIARAIDAGRSGMDLAMGPGAGDLASCVTVNIGRIAGGLKVNIIPGTCRFTLDIRLPVGMSRDEMKSHLDRIIERYPDARVEEVNHSPPSHCDPNGQMIKILRTNAEESGGYEPVPIVSLGGTDARLWRYENIPAYVYGPMPTGMGAADEHVDVEEFLHVVRTHALSSYDYLQAM